MTAGIFLSKQLVLRSNKIIKGFNIIAVHKYLHYPSIHTRQQKQIKADEHVTDYNPTDTDNGWNIEK